MSLNPSPVGGSQTPPATGNAFDDSGTQQVCQSTRVRLWSRLLAAVLITAAIAVLAIVDVRLAQIALIPVAITAYVVAQFAISGLLWLRRIERILRTYPWEQRPGLRRRNVTGQRSRSSHVVNIARAQGGWSPEMVMSPAVGHHTWEEDMASNLWLAGDERFGGVVAIPGGRSPMLFQPRLREQSENHRTKADPADRERAQRAGIDRKIL